MSVKVMKDPWLRVHGSSWVPSSHNQEIHNMHVSDLMVQGQGVWDANKVHSLFHPLVAKNILSVPLLSPNDSDLLVWNEDSSGIYSVKSAYRLMRRIMWNEEKFQQEGDWNIVWNANAPPKVRNFVWRISRGCLPTQKRLNERHVPCRSGCVLCTEVEESD